MTTFEPKTALRENLSSSEKSASREIFGSNRNSTYQIERNPLETQQEKLNSTYKTASGRSSWLGRDPIGEKGGINLYGFVGNQPTNWFDILGARPETATEKKLFKALLLVLTADQKAAVKNLRDAIAKAPTLADDCNRAVVVALHQWLYHNTKFAKDETVPAIKGGTAKFGGGGMFDDENKCNLFPAWCYGYNLGWSRHKNTHTTTGVRGYPVSNAGWPPLANAVGKITGKIRNFHYPKEITGVVRPKPSDLISYPRKGESGHMGIAVDENMVIHASSEILKFEKIDDVLINVGGTGKCYCRSYK